MDRRHRTLFAVLVVVLGLTAASFASSFGVMAVGPIRFAVDMQRLLSVAPLLTATTFAGAFISILWLPPGYGVRRLARAGPPLSLLAAGGFAAALVGVEHQWRLRAVVLAATLATLLLNAAWIAAILATSGIASSTGSKRPQHILSWTLLMFAFAHMTGGFASVLPRVPLGQVFGTASLVLFAATFALTAIAGAIVLCSGTWIRPETFD